jgi:uncharacterized protein
MSWFFSNKSNRKLLRIFFATDLHGHIHESPGAIRLGRTLCINPGSEYGEGILRGALITFSDRKIEHYQLTTG